MQAIAVKSWRSYTYEHLQDLMTIRSEIFGFCYIVLFSSGAHIIGRRTGPVLALFRHTMPSINLNVPVQGRGLDPIQASSLKEGFFFNLGNGLSCFFRSFSISFDFFF